MARMDMCRARPIGLSLWTSAMLSVRKLSFKLQSSNITSVDVICAVARGTYAPAARCESSIKAGRAVILLQAERKAWLGETPTPSRRGAPYWK